MKNKCWAINCNKKIKKHWPYCDECFKKDVKLKVPGIKGFDNTPTKT